MDYDGFKARNILSLPIENGEKRVIGVVQLMNKCDGKTFTDTDVNSVQVMPSNTVQSVTISLKSLLYNVVILHTHYGQMLSSKKCNQYFILCNT